MTTPIIDAHHHFWRLADGRLAWMSSDLKPLYRDFGAAELTREALAVGITGSVLVQGANLLAETTDLLATANEHDLVSGVVGWVPLSDPAALDEALTRWGANPMFVGVRHLINEEPDPDWLVRPEVLRGLQVLADHDIPFDVVAVLPRHLEHVATVAAEIPGLRMVIDHLGKPPIADGQWEPWASLLAGAARFPQVFAKVSGLTTCASPTAWTPKDLYSWVDHALEVFGADRLMIGSDWPVSLLSGSFRQVFNGTVASLASLSDGERDHVLGLTAINFYALDPTKRRYAR